jgi:Ca2+-binding RTX toxin-like protein
VRRRTSRVTVALVAVAVAGTLLAVVSVGAPGQERVLRGTQKADTLVGTARGEKMFGFRGDDWLRGLGGNDTIVGGPGRDTLSGGPGNDLVLARDGERDRVFCGRGKDRAVVDANDSTYRDCETVKLPPPAPAPPESRTDCSVTNYTAWTWEQCKPGTTITVTNQPWHCRQPLTSYGKLPIKIVSISTAAWDDIAVTVNSGCTGPAGTDVNLIVDIRGEGPNSASGSGGDAFKTRVNPRNLRITGSIQCGRRAPDAHQDALQIQGGTDIVFVNVEGGGDYEAGTSTCQGAGGGPFYSLNQITNVDVVGGRWIACNHALSGTHPGTENDIVGAKFRSGRTDGSDPDCAQFHSSRPCVDTRSLRLQNVSCQEWRGGRWVAVSPR